MNPLVSLVSPVYNAMPWLESFLDCMVQQTWRPLEVILVEDGSTDASRECLLRRRGELEDAGIAVRPQTLATASRTPLPPKRVGSPSRSSWAS